MKKIAVVILGALLMPSLSYATSLEMTAVSLIGVDKKGNPLVEIKILEDGKVSLQTKEKKEPEIIEAERMPIADISRWKLGDHGSFSYSPGVSRMGAYRNRVGHFTYYPPKGEEIELLPDVVIQKQAE